ncbi:MAG TPA: VTT domain-containing protein [Candidatus Deferrimicrobium sp.]|nr:VTT domain-containing protein [Candidatus Deferrimicrobium sp.]
MSRENEILTANEQKQTKTWWNKKNIIILSSMIIFIVILAVIALSGRDLGSIFSGWTDAYYLMFGALGIYLIVFLISTFANMTILFPVPYAVVLMYIAIKIHEGGETGFIGLNIWLLGIIAGVGAAIGEVTAYYLGKGSAKLLESKEQSAAVQKMKDRISRGWAVPLMFLCAATFIPDDPLLILLGYAGYPLWKMLVTYFFGKITLCITTIYFVILSFNIPALKNFYWILGLSETGAPINPWVSFGGWVGVLLLFFLIFFVDWTSKFKKVYRKLFKRQEKVSESNIQCLLGKNLIIMRSFQIFEKYNFLK